MPYVWIGILTVVIIYYGLKWLKQRKSIYELEDEINQVDIEETTYSLSEELNQKKQNLKQRKKESETND